MPGGFAHITLVAKVIEGMDGIEGLSDLDRLALGQHLSFCEIGAVAPDYPYLALGDADAAPWADFMHYQRTGDVIRDGVKRLRARPTGPGRNKALAWILGYAAHVGMDLTIHPIVEMRVGRYADHKKEHRECEMHQDSFIWRDRGLGEIGVADYFDAAIKACSDGDGQLDRAVADLWREMLSAIYPEQFSANPPNINAWHRGYKKIVDAAEEGYKLFPAARHLLASQGAGYPRTEEIDASFIENLRTPEGPMHYRDIFDRAVSNVAAIWSTIAEALNATDLTIADRILQGIPDADLDTGRAFVDNKHVFWRAA